MRRLFSFFVALACSLCLLALPAPARALEGEPAINEATAACIMDGEGRLLWTKNADMVLPPASITKVMTAMVALDSGIDFDEPFIVAETQFNEAAQVAGYAPGDIVTFGELLRTTLIYSANDAAQNLAYIVGGSQEGFAELMNQKAAAIGLTNTHFMNPHGLEEPDHYSTAFDLCVMGRYAMERYPFIRECVHTPSITIVANGATVTLETTDALMGVYEGLRGIKTGNTESGTSFLSSARRGGVTLYGCALCCATREGRFDDTAIMLDWAFNQYPERTLAHGSWMLDVAPWQDGFWLSCPVYTSHDVVAHPFPEGEISYTTVSERPNSYVAGGSTYGTTVWTQDDHLVTTASYCTTKPQQTKAWNPFVTHLFSNHGEVEA